MRKPVYFTNKTIIMNYTKEFFEKPSELINSEGFEMFIKAYIDDLKLSNPALHNWLIESLDKNKIAGLIKLLKVLLVLDIDDINHPLLDNRKNFLEVIELAYNFWRKKERFSILETRNETGLQFVSFIDADNKFNELAITLYRLLQEKVQGYKNRIYRQLQAGTNASLLLRKYNTKLPKSYDELKDILFINTIMLRTPLIYHPSSNKRTGAFSKKDTNLIDEFNKDKDEWLCYPCKVGTLLVFIYFHQDYLASVTALSNLFELASQEDCLTLKPDAVILFGNKDGLDETVYNYDKENDIWVGKVSYCSIIEYFGYLKKMTLTLFNLSMMSKGYLPIHGAMVNLYLNDGTKKGVCLMGDSGAGKSETIEALNKISAGKILRSEVIFDDMGVMYIKDNKIHASGSEIGAFVRLDDLDKGSAYRDMDRSIFFNPETANARVVIPCTSHEVVISDHIIDVFMYANNYDNERGIELFSNKEKAIEVFKKGCRMALGTTQEKGLSFTYFANPFGPMQHPDICDPIIDKMFTKLFNDNIKVGQIYTCLGLDVENEEGIDIAASKLLDLTTKL